MSVLNPPMVRPMSARSPMRRRMRRFTAVSGMTLLAVMVVSAFLLPLLFMITTSFKDKSQLTALGAPWYPAAQESYEFEGAEYPLYTVPLPDGTERSLALYQPGRESSVWLDPADPAAPPIDWEGRWRVLEPTYRFELYTNNFTTAWDALDFPKLLFNTLMIAGIGTIGAVTSAICVAYGFSRFRFPGRNGLFLLLLATIILPMQVTLIPTYAVFAMMGWTGTWLPLIVPYFFGNAYNVFLLRQYFLTIPRELDEAAMIDGAGPFRILISVIVPQAKAAIVAVSLFHFFWAWNEFYLPLIYLQGNQSAEPLSTAIARFNGVYSQEPTLIQAAAIMAMIIPVAVFFLAQRAFMRGIVFSGVEK
jgi:multiple sugar transport system permease protein